MDKIDVQTRVIKVVCQVLGADPKEVTVESDFVYDLGAESAQSVGLVTAFEAEFGIEMDHEEALKVQTIAGAADYIAQHVQ
jgi:acyl carrier protein